MFICKICDKEYDEKMRYSRDSRYCKKCGEERTRYLSYRRDTLSSLRSMPLEAKIIQTKFLIKQAVITFGEDNCYISYSGGKDSTVLSHITKQLYPNILHLFANTTNEYPETLKHIQWEIMENHTNITIVYPIDSKGEMWNFKKVVERYGYPMFSKRVSNAIRTYQHAKTPRTKQNSIDYIECNFKKYQKYIELHISDKCCDKLKKEPLRRKAKELGMQCVILGILASESYQREKAWLEYGCNVFFKFKDNQCKPLSFWTDEDINEYIKKYNVKIPDLYHMGYTRNGCMFCGFGVHLENPESNRFQKLKETHPKQYAYFIENFSDMMLQFDVVV